MSTPFNDDEILIDMEVVDCFKIARRNIYRFAEPKQTLHS
jgi:hypothetical protein